MMSTPPDRSTASQLAGLPNFRDFGGHPTRDGGRVRYGLLYRSQSLHFATEEDLQQLARMNVRLVCDLRSGIERQRHPGRWHAGPDPVRLHLEINTDVRAHNSEFVAVVRNSPDRDGVYRAMLVNYRSMPKAFAPVLAEFFAHLTKAEHLPAVIHCHAGKDRTGFICAVILGALGVDREHVIADYLRTAQVMNREQMSIGLAERFSRLIGAPLSPEILQPILDVQAEYLEAALAQIDADFGSFDSYLEQVGGLKPARRTELRRLLVE